MFLRAEVASCVTFVFHRLLLSNRNDKIAEMEQQDVLTVDLRGSVGFPLHCVKHSLDDGFCSLRATSKPNRRDSVCLTPSVIGLCFVY